MAIAAVTPQVALIVLLLGTKTSRDGRRKRDIVKFIPSKNIGTNLWKILQGDYEGNPFIGLGLVCSKFCFNVL